MNFFYFRFAYFNSNKSIKNIVLRRNLASKNGINEINLTLIPSNIKENSRKTALSILHLNSLDFSLVKPAMFSPNYQTHSRRKQREQIA